MWWANSVVCSTWIKIFPFYNWNPLLPPFTRQLLRLFIYMILYFRQSKKTPFVYISSICSISTAKNITDGHCDVIVILLIMYFYCTFLPACCWVDITVPSRNSTCKRLFLFVYMVTVCYNIIARCPIWCAKMAVMHCTAIHYVIWKRRYFLCLRKMAHSAIGEQL